MFDDSSSLTIVSQPNSALFSPPHDVICQCRQHLPVVLCFHPWVWVTSQHVSLSRFSIRLFRYRKDCTAATSLYLFSFHRLRQKSIIWPQSHQIFSIVIVPPPHASRGITREKAHPFANHFSCAKSYVEIHSACVSYHFPRRTLPSPSSKPSYSRRCLSEAFVHCLRPPVVVFFEVLFPGISLALFVRRPLTM